jgi:hypothetical protein
MGPFNVITLCRIPRSLPRRLAKGEGGGMKYLVREKMFAIGDDFWIEDEHGN